MSIGDYCRDLLQLNEGKSRQKNKKVFNKKLNIKCNLFILTSTAVVVISCPMVLTGARFC